MNGSLSICRRWFSVSSEFIFVWLLICCFHGNCGCFYTKHWSPRAWECCRGEDTAQGGAERGSCTLLPVTPGFSVPFICNSAPWIFFLLFSPPRGAGLRAFNGAFLESDQLEPIYSKKSINHFCAGQTLDFYFAVKRCWCWAGDPCTASLWLPWFQGGISEGFWFIKRADLWLNLCWCFLITPSAGRVCLRMLRFCVRPSV